MSINSLKRWFFYLPPVLWMSFLFYLSNRSSIPTGQTYWADFVIKKTAHFTVYAVLFWLWYWGLRKNDKSRAKAQQIAVILSLLYACFDEFHQSWVPGRNAKLRDVLIDVGGVIVAYSLTGYGIITKIRSMKKGIVLLLGLAVFIGAGKAVWATVQVHKIMICHRTSSQTNPYQSIEIDLDATGGQIQDRGNGDHTQHTGDVFDPDFNYQGNNKDWGDIIPPFIWEDQSYPGLNWTTWGQAIYNNNCQIPSPTPAATVTPTPTAISTPVPTVTPTATPTQTPTSTPAGTPTPTPVATNTPTPTATATTEPSQTPTSTPTPAITSTPEPTPTPTPEATNTPTPSSTSESGTGGSSESSSSSSESNSGVGDGQVLGTSTLPQTGFVQEAVMHLVFALGATLSAFGIRAKASL